MKNKKILVVAPHPDDEVLGVGGSIKKFSKLGNKIHVLTLSGHLPPLYSKKDYDKTISEAKKAHKILGVNDSEFIDFPATFLNEKPTHVINNIILNKIKNFKHQIVFIPFPDRNVDHKVIFESCMVATRPLGSGKSIEILAAYETLSETHWNAPYIEHNFVPNWNIDITKEINQKLKALNCFKSQIPPFPGSRSIEAIKALSIFRGTQSGFKFGESFIILRKIS